jgi:rhamnogalacturonyl hydrolase YesR
MRKSAHLIFYVLLVSIITSSPAFAQTPAQKPNDANTPLHLLRPDYPVPYGPMKADQIAAVLNRLRDYLDASTPPRLINARTKEEIKDFSRITREAALEPGVFRLISYEWGVTYTGMLLAGEATGERRYFDDAAKQILQFSQRMFNRNKGLYMHGWVQGMDVHPEFHWARANGWALLATVDLLDVLPENHPSRAAIIDLLRAHIRGLAACQSASGFWHQLLDRSDSYLETSATAIYTYGIAHAINKGWIDPIAQGPMVISGWNAVSTKVNTQGQVEGTCVGTGRKEIFKLPFSRSAASRLGKSGLNLSLVAACRAVCICAFKTFSRRRHGQRARPGAGKCFAASSSTRTQSSISPLSGGTNSRSPRLSNSPAACARPVRGLNHHAFTFEPVMTSIRTLNGLPAGV